MTFKKIDENQVVLVAEDSDDDYEMTLRALRKDKNFLNPIVRAKDGQEVFDYLETNKVALPGLLLLDLNMPGVDGHTVLKKLKTDSSLKNIPIVILTTSGSLQDVDSCYAAGANTYVQKPVHFEGFFSAMRSIKEYWFNVSVLPRVVL